MTPVDASVILGLATASRTHVDAAGRRRGRREGGEFGVSLAGQIRCLDETRCVCKDAVALRVDKDGQGEADGELLDVAAGGDVDDLSTV